MSVREIAIKQLRLKAPRQHNSEAFAGSVAASLAAQVFPVVKNRSVKELRVKVPRDQTHPGGIARAIRAALSEER
jgi:hypothetical protein